MDQKQEMRLVPQCWPALFELGVSLGIRSLTPRTHQQLLVQFSLLHANTTPKQHPAVNCALGSNSREVNEIYFYLFLISGKHRSVMQMNKSETTNTIQILLNHNSEHSPHYVNNLQNKSRTYDNGFLKLRAITFLLWKKPCMRLQCWIWQINWVSLYSWLWADLLPVICFSNKNRSMYNNGMYSSVGQQGNTICGRTKRIS